MSSASTSAPSRRRVLIVEDDTLVGLGLKSDLEALGHEVIAQVSTSERAVEVYRDSAPDFVLLDVRLDGSDGIDLAQQLLAHRRCPMIIISAYSEKEMVARATAAGVFGYLIKPVSGPSLAAQLEVAAGRFDEHEETIRENEDLTKALETRKLADRAKGVLMKRLKLDEPEAHKRLQLESQKRRISLAEMAKRVIDSDELLGEP